MFKRPMGKIQARWIYDKILREITVKLNSYIYNYAHQIINLSVFKHYFANWKTIYFMQRMGIK